MLTSSGQAATLTAVLTIAKAGDHILCGSTVYGGTFNLMAVTFKRMGIDVTFFEQSRVQMKKSKLRFRRTHRYPQVSRYYLCWSC